MKKLFLDLFKDTGHPGDKILEIKPCPTRLRIYREMGLQPWGMDNDVRNIQHLQSIFPDIDLRCGNLTSLPYQSEEKFQIITFFNVLNEMMIPEAKSFLLNIGALLSEEGSIVFSMLEQNYRPPWWDSGTEIENGRLVLEGEFTGEIYGLYEDEDIYRLMLEFVNIENFKTEVGTLWKARKF
ncbi:MAG: hypothetical protein APR63_01765 [Desulfuromonas sp. SDB]|nr:MAG: hypothetical protein APR63_01765 [Desulfuromonas sp. SDB]